VSLTLSPGDRIALLGRNGAGKSTCMKLLAGELSAIGGARTEARDLRVGYFAQHQLEQLSPADSAIENLRRAGGERAAAAMEQDLRDHLAGFGFRGDRVFEPVAPFSGGEKARLVLALLAYLRPNLLLLDEPTNHLDLEMRQALAVALQDYAGAVVMVSHDRHLLRTVSDAFYVVHSGRAEPFDGDIEDYAKWLAESETATAAPATAGSSDSGESAESRKQRKREEAQRRNRLAPLREAVLNCERELERLGRLRAEVQAQLAAPEAYADDAKARLRELLDADAKLARETAQAEAQWLDATEQLESQTHANGCPAGGKNH
jgi:ATP-binding cassette subfamily F protein 3